MKMKEVSIVIMAVILLFTAIYDGKRKEIPGIFVILMTLVSVMSQAFVIKSGIADCLCGAAIGILFVGLAILSKEQMGIGDGLMIAAIGIGVGLRRVLWMVSIASVIMAAVVIILLLMKKIKKEATIPFLPFLFGGYLLCYLFL